MGCRPDAKQLVDESLTNICHASEVDLDDLKVCIKAV
jgi:hypothetical protein